MWGCEAARQLHPAEVCGNTWWPHTPLDRHKPAHTQFQVSYKRLSILSMYIFPPRLSLYSRSRSGGSLAKFSAAAQNEIQTNQSRARKLYNMPVKNVDLWVPSGNIIKTMTEAVGWWGEVFGGHEVKIWSPQMCLFIDQNSGLSPILVAKIVFYLCRIFTVSLGDSWHKC